MFMELGEGWMNLGVAQPPVPPLASGCTPSRKITLVEGSHKPVMDYRVSWL